MIVSPLIKLLREANSSRVTLETMDGPYDFLTDKPVAGRNTVVDCGLGICDALIGAVRRGFIVHGFEPVPGHVALCRRGLPAGSYFDVPLPPVGSPPSAWRRVSQQLPPPPEGRGFAYLYNAAVGDRVGAVNMTVNEGWSTILTKTPAGGRGKYSPRIQVPVLPLDDVLDVEQPVWLFKMDLQGYELRALRGAQRLLARGRVAHVQAEFCPFLLDTADPPDGADGVLAQLHEHRLVCFDWGAPRYMPSLPAAERPSSPHGWVQAMRNHTERGMRHAHHVEDAQREVAQRAAAYQVPRTRMSAEKTWKLIGSCDDLVCVNARSSRAD